MIGQDDFARAIKECVVRWPVLEKQLDVYYGHLKHLNADAFVTICGRFVEDFRSMPLPRDFKEAFDEWKSQNNYRAPREEQDSQFKLHFMANCRGCGKKNTDCIEEPLNAEFRCRQCYTGLTNEQISARFRKLAEVMGTVEPRRKMTGKPITELDADIRHPTSAQVLKRQQELLKQVEYLKEHGVPDKLYDEHGDRIPY